VVTLSIVDFLNARLTEDERLAREASQGIGDGQWGTGLERQVRSARLALVAETAVPHHIARHDPARVLREVTAKRAIAREHGPSGKHTTVWEWSELGHWCPECAAEPCRQLNNCPICGGDDGCRTVRLLAAIYGDHPDYREEWRP
jgi:hypothetical protein